MVFALTTFYILICLFLIIVVLLQSGKAADLAGAFGGMGSQTAFGPRGAATLLTKATTTAAVLFMMMSIVLGILRTQQRGSGDSVLERTGAAEQVPAGEAVPAAPVPAGGEAGSERVRITPGPDGVADVDLGEVIGAPSAGESGGATEQEQ